MFSGTRSKSLISVTGEVIIPYLTCTYNIDGNNDRIDLIDNSIFAPVKQTIYMVFIFCPEAVKNELQIFCIISIIKL
jgi:hypothetical protein